MTLLEANGRKCAFLRQVAREFPNVTVVQGRAEEQEPDRFGAAVAKALAALERKASMYKNLGSYPAAV